MPPVNLSTRSYLLKEDGGRLLLETGGGILLNPQDGIGVEVEFSEDTWTNVANDVLIKRRVRAQYGIQGNAPLDHVARTGTMDYYLRNDDGNSGGLEGYYSPNHANVRPNFELSVGNRLAITYSGSTFFKWRGRLASVVPTPGIRGRKDVKCQALDWFDIAARTKMRLVPTAFEQRADEGIAMVVANMPDAPPASSLAAGQDTYPTIFDDVRDERSTVLRELNKLTISELGFTYPRGDQLTGGVLTFEDRHTRPKYGQSSASISGSMVRFGTSRHIRGVFNRVKLTAHPRELSAAASVLFTLQTVPYLSPGASMIIEGRYTDPEQRGAIRVGGASMVTPASSTDYTMNTASAGGATDLTAFFSVNASFGGNTARISVANDGETGGYVTLLQTRGRLIVTKEPTISEKFDQGSIDTYGENVLSVSMPYQQDPLVTEDAANTILGNWKDPTTQLPYVEFLGNTSDELMKLGLRMEPGDKVTLVDEITGVDVDVFIQGVGITISEPDVIKFKWIVALAETTRFWILGIVGSSEVGVTMIPGY